jgi:hypothetical protein
MQFISVFGYDAASVIEDGEWIELSRVSERPNDSILLAVLANKPYAAALLTQSSEDRMSCVHAGIRHDCHARLMVRQRSPAKAKCDPRGCRQGGGC